MKTDVVQIVQGRFSASYIRHGYNDDRADIGDNVSYLRDHFYRLTRWHPPTYNAVFIFRLFKQWPYVNSIASFLFVVKGMKLFEFLALCSQWILHPEVAVLRTIFMQLYHNETRWPLSGKRHIWVWLSRDNLCQPFLVTISDMPLSQNKNTEGIPLVNNYPQVCYLNAGTHTAEPPSNMYIIP